MANIVDWRDYGAGYDEGVRDATRDVAAQYEATVNKLQMENEILRAQIAVGSKSNGQK